VGNWKNARRKYADGVRGALPRIQYFEYSNRSSVNMQEILA